MSGGKKHVKLGYVQNIFAIAVIAVIFWVVQNSVIPYGVAKFVLPLFQPTGDEMEKMGFVHFEGDGLVWASTSKENGEKMGGQEGLTLKKELINGEFIFDFSKNVRQVKIHKYSKQENEFYIKAPKLGEQAIIIEPYVAFTIISVVIGAVLMLLLTMVLPPQIGLMACLFEEQIEHVKTNIRIQTGFSDEIVDILTLPNKEMEQIDRDRLEHAFRVVWNRTVTEAEKSSDHRINFEDVWDDEIDVVFFRSQAIYQRIKEYFSQFVEVEINNTKDARSWSKNKLQIFKGLRLYMAQHFSHHYANTVTGAAYGGAAILIIAVGIRGLKFIPAAKPSMIMGAIFLEFTLLALMAITLLYTEGEERTDKMLKKMEDANRSQLEAIKGQSEDIHQLAGALVGQSSDIVKAKVEAAISEYMTSGTEVNKQIAEAIANKIVFDIIGKK